jgi:hypothetical protein
MVRVGVGKQRIVKRVAESFDKPISPPQLECSQSGLRSYHFRPVTQLSCSIILDACRCSHVFFAFFVASITPVSIPRCSSASTTATIPLPSASAAPANTAKLSSTLLQPTSGLSFAGDTNRPPNQRRHSERAASSMDTKAARRRRSSSLMYTEPPESLEHISDQAALPNLNSEWVNAKGL